MNMQMNMWNQELADNAEDFGLCFALIPVHDKDIYLITTGYVLSYKYDDFFILPFVKADVLICYE